MPAEIAMTELGGPMAQMKAHSSKVHDLLIRSDYIEMHVGNSQFDFQALPAVSKRSTPPHIPICSAPLPLYSASFTSTSPLWWPTWSLYAVWQRCLLSCLWLASMIAHQCVRCSGQEEPRCFHGHRTRYDSRLPARRTRSSLDWSGTLTWCVNLL